MNIVFKSKREKVVFSVFVSLLTWGVLSMIVIMLWSLKADGVVLMDFNAFGELWIELPLAGILAGFGFWLMWFVAKKGKVGHISLLTRKPLTPEQIISEAALMREWDNKYDEVRTCLTKK